MIKLFISDIDGTLTDGTVWYSKKGEELKQFSHKDGRGFHLLHELNIQCALITSESKGINKARFKKFHKLGTVQDFADGVYGKGKVERIKKLCNKYNIAPEEIAFIGDDTNDYEALEYVGMKACPNDANYKIKGIENIFICKNNGGGGAVREFIDYLIDNKMLYNKEKI